MALPSSQYSWLNGNLPAFGNGPNNSWMPSYSDFSLGGGGNSGGSSYLTGMGLDSVGGIAGNIAGFGVPAAAGAIATYFSNKSKNKQAALDRQAAVNAQQSAQEMSAGTNAQSIAQRESELDPFRQQMAQGADVSKLDRLERASFTPARIDIGAAGPVASGGYSYSKSPELVKSAAALKSSIMSGQGAPSMTNVANYGKTSALDLNGVLAGKLDPTQTSSFATGAPAAASSLGAEPTANLVRQGFISVLGRPGSDQEIQTILGTLGKIYGHPMTPADAPLIQDWISKNLMTSPEAMARKPQATPQLAQQPYRPSYAAA
jgi:hypothetical protein